MAPLQYSTFTKVLLFLLFFVFNSILTHAYTKTLPTTNHLFSTRKLLDLKQNKDHPISKKSNTTLSSNNQTKLIKPTTNSTRNQTKPIKPTQFKKLNTTKPTSLHTKKPLDLTKPTKPISSKQAKIPLDKKNPTFDKPNTRKQKQPTWNIDEEDEEDLVSEFRDLPTRFQETLLPDLEILSTTSKVYLNRANNEITKGFKPIVGKKYAPIIASIVSFAFILIPLILVSLIFNYIKAYFSLQKLIILIQIYLSIYFSILCLSSLVTGLEPLRFFYATSRSTYVCLQVLQMLAYVLYLLLLLMYLILVFSGETGLGLKLLGLVQTFVGLAVGLHYYVAVFHLAVLYQPPKSSWRVHAIYATCFFVTCLLARAERRKKAYLVVGEEGGKKS